MDTTARILILTCSACGENTEEFVEGYCPACQAERQAQLDSHNAQYDAWAKLSDRERGDRIRRAM